MKTGGIGLRIPELLSLDFLPMRRPQVSQLIQNNRWKTAKRLLSMNMQIKSCRLPRCIVVIVSCLKNSPSMATVQMSCLMFFTMRDKTVSGVNRRCLLDPRKVCPTDLECMPFRIIRKLIHCFR